ncbi:hypothetical protein ACFLW5_02475 [Chloroflexota bacterium]
MVQSIVIRLAVEEDIDCIIALYRELAITTSKVELSQNPSPDDYQQTFSRIRIVP